MTSVSLHSDGSSAYQSRLGSLHSSTSAYYSHSDMQLLPPFPVWILSVHLDIHLGTCLAHMGAPHGSASIAMGGPSQSRFPPYSPPVTPSIVGIGSGHSYGNTYNTLVFPDTTDYSNPPPLPPYSTSSCPVSLSRPLPPPLIRAISSSPLSSHGDDQYELVFLTKRVKKCYGCGTEFDKRSDGNLDPPHDIVVHHADFREYYLDGEKRSTKQKQNFIHAYLAYHQSAAVMSLSILTFPPSKTNLFLHMLCTCGIILDCKFSAAHMYLLPNLVVTVLYIYHNYHLFWCPFI